MSTSFLFLKPKFSLNNLPKNKAKTVKTKQIHHSQVITKENLKYLEIQLFLIVNYELKKLIWSFGDSVIVVEPVDLFTRQLRK